MTFKSSPWLSSIQFIAHIYTYTHLLQYSLQMNKRDYSHFSIWYHTANCWLVHSQFWFRSERMRENNSIYNSQFVVFFFILSKNKILWWWYSPIGKHISPVIKQWNIYISVLNFYIQWQWRVNQRQTSILIILCFRVNFNESLYIDVS
jgi:hypothetical protein